MQLTGLTGTWVFPIRCPLQQIGWARQHTQALLHDWSAKLKKYKTAATYAKKYKRCPTTHVPGVSEKNLNSHNMSLDPLAHTPWLSPLLLCASVNEAMKIINVEVTCVWTIQCYNFFFNRLMKPAKLCIQYLKRIFVGISHYKQSTSTKMLLCL